MKCRSQECCNILDYKKNTVIRNLQCLSKQLGPLFADTTFPVFHFTDVPLWYLRYFRQ